MYFYNGYRNLECNIGLIGSKKSKAERVAKNAKILQMNRAKSHKKKRPSFSSLIVIQIEDGINSFSQSHLIAFQSSYPQKLLVYNLLHSSSSEVYIQYTFKGSTQRRSAVAAVGRTSVAESSGSPRAACLRCGAYAASERWLAPSFAPGISEAASALLLPSASLRFGQGQSERVQQSLQSSDRSVRRSLQGASSHR